VVRPAKALDPPYQGPLTVHVEEQTTLPHVLIAGHFGEVSEETGSNGLADEPVVETGEVPLKAECKVPIFESPSKALVLRSSLVAAVVLLWVACFVQVGVDYISDLVWQTKQAGPRDAWCVYNVTIFFPDRDGWKGAHCKA